MKQRPSPRDQSTITTTMETEEPTEEGSSPGGTSTTTEGPTWSPPRSRTTGTARAATTADHQKEKTWKTSTNLRNESGGQDNRAMALGHSAPQRNNLTDR